MKCPSCQQPTNAAGNCTTTGCKFDGHGFISVPGQHDPRPPDPVPNIFGSPLEQAMFCREFLDIFRELTDHVKALSTRIM